VAEGSAPPALPGREAAESFGRLNRGHGGVKDTEMAVTQITVQHSPT